MRSPLLYDTLRRFCLGAFALYHQDMDKGADLPFAFEEHGSYGRPTLYEYRPLVRGYVEARADRLYQRDDVRSAVADLQREPAARIFARAHEGHYGDEGRALFRSVLVPLLVRTAESCGGFDWDDSAFDRAYAELEGSLFGEGHAYGAVAPLVGISCGTTIELGDGIRVRAAAAGELAAMWPEAAGLLPRDFGRETDRLCVLELERVARAGHRRGSGRAGRARRRRHVAPTRHRGPRRRRPRSLRAARLAPVRDPSRACRSPRPQPPGEPTRLDPFRATVVAQLRPCLAVADDDPDVLGDALDRWELALFQGDPFRAEQLRHALESALGDGQGLWAAGMRGAALLGDTPEERADLAGAGCRGSRATELHAPAACRAAPPRRPPPAPARARRRAARASPAAGARRRAASRARNHPRRDMSPATVGTWTRPAPCWSGWNGSKRSTRRAAAPDELLAELRALVREAESWARRERDPEAQAAAARCADAIDAHAIVPL